MARMTLTVILIVLVNVLIGCNEANATKVYPAKQPRVDIPNAGEVDIAEQLAASRQAYRKGLETLVKYYNTTGNNMKLAWAKEELASLTKVRQYNYIIEAAIPANALRASQSILEADYLFADILKFEKQARFLVIVNEDQLREALEKYDAFIKNYPASDKIDNAAFRIAGIHEHFQDYTVAVLYYQRAYQWDAQTDTPAVFKAAYNLDRRLHRMDEALELYRIAAKIQTISLNYRDFAQMRIAELTQTETSDQ